MSGLLVRNHLLCPYLDCSAHQRSSSLRIRALVDVERKVVLQKSIVGKKTRSRLRFLNQLWVIPSKCPYCNRPVEVVIDSFSCLFSYLNCQNFSQKTTKIPFFENYQIFTLRISFFLASFGWITVFCSSSWKVVYTRVTNSRLPLND